jgi:hypothetical protein
MASLFLRPAWQRSQARLRVPDLPGPGIRQGHPVKVSGLVTQPWTKGDRSGWPSGPPGPSRPCHKRAIHSGPDRAAADNHGQCQSGLDLRRSASSQVTTLPDLALGAGGRS